MPENDPWGIYSKIGNDWAVLGAQIIPLPANRCPDQISDWVAMHLPNNPTPYNMPVFVIDQIVTMRRRQRITLYLKADPTTRVYRDLCDVLEKWRPAPTSFPVPEEPEAPVVLSRYKRSPVI